SVQYFNAVLQALSYATTVSPISNLRGIKLDNNYDVVWLFQTENINEEGWDKLYGYVDGGGKLAVVPPGLKSASWTDKAALRLLPGKLGKKIETETSSGVPWKIDSSDTSPFMASFIKMKDERDSVDFIKTERWRSARRYWTVDLDKGSKVLGRFD